MGGWGIAGQRHFFVECSQVRSWAGSGELGLGWSPGRSRTLRAHIGHGVVCDSREGMPLVVYGSGRWCCRPVVTSSVGSV